MTQNVVLTCLPEGLANIGLKRREQLWYVFERVCGVLVVSRWEFSFERSCRFGFSEPEAYLFVQYTVHAWEFSKSALSRHITRPTCVNKIDWIDSFWPNDEKEAGLFPKVQKQVTLSPAGMFAVHRYRLILSQARLHTSTSTPAVPPDGITWLRGNRFSCLSLQPTRISKRTRIGF